MQGEHLPPRYHPVTCNHLAVLTTNGPAGPGSIAENISNSDSHRGALLGPVVVAVWALSQQP